MVDNCIFCEIATGASSGRLVYEDEHTIALLNRNQLNDGHILVIPRQHFQDIFDIPPDIFCHVTQTVQRVSRMLRENMGYKNLNIWQSNGALAGQEIWHLHVHILPRLNVDELGFYTRPPRQPGREELEHIAGRVRGAT